MNLFKKIGTFLGVVLLAVIAFITGQRELKPKKDPYEDRQKDLEDKIQDLEENGVEAKDLDPEEVEEFWRR